MSPTILTSLGLYFNLQEPDPADVDIDDIAYALSNICRFTGHVHTYYSVAEHCYRASLIVPSLYALQALLHDAAEAYIGDVSSPLKRLLPDYRAIEERVEAAVLTHFKLPLKPHPCVKQADLVMLATEQRDLLPHHDDDWAVLKGIDPLPDFISPLPPHQARMRFLERYRALTLGDQA